MEEQSAQYFRINENIGRTTDRSGVCKAVRVNKTNCQAFYWAFLSRLTWTSFICMTQFIDEL